MNWLNRLFRRGVAAGQSADEEGVAVYDVDRQEIIWISANDLPPGHIQAQMEGLDHHVWIDPTRLAPGRSPSL